MEHLTLDQIRDTLSEIGRDLFKEYSEQPVFRPLLDLNLGEFGTDYPIRIGSELRIDPQFVTIALIEKLPDPLRSFATGKDGFINFSPNIAIQRRTGELSPFYIPINNPVRLLVLQSDSQHLPISNLRLASYATIQAIGLATFGETLYIGDDKAPIHTGKELLSYLKSALGQERCNGIYTGLEFLKGLYSKDKDSIFFLWITPDLFRNQEFISFMRNDPERLRVKSSISPLLTADVRPEIYNKLKSYDDTQLISLALYLAKNRQGEDLDLVTPSLGEADNLYWFINTTITRIRSILDADRVKVEDSFDQITNFTKEDLLVLKRIEYIYDFFALSAARGEVSEFISSLQSLTILTTQYLNNPTKRRELNNNKRNSTEIVTGAFKALSAIMEILSPERNFRDENI